MLKQLQKAGLQVETPKDGTVIFHNASMGAMAKEIKFPFEMYISSGEDRNVFTAVKYGEGDVVNASWGPQLVVNDAILKSIKERCLQKMKCRMSKFLTLLTKTNLPKHLQFAHQILG